MPATAFNLKSREFIIKGIEALDAACEEGTFDKSALDLSEFDKQERNAFNLFIKSAKGDKFSALKDAFKAYCMGAPKVLPKQETAPKKLVKSMPQEAKTEKVQPKGNKKTEKVAPKAAKSVSVASPIIHSKLDTDEGITLVDGSLSLCGVRFATVRTELRKRLDAHEVTVTWKLWKNAQQVDICMLPNAQITKKQDIDYWLKKIAAQLVLLYLQPTENNDSHPHPADSQGQMNDPDRPL